jgi:hypothetical protein
VTGRLLRIRFVIGISQIGVERADRTTGQRRKRAARAGIIRGISDLASSEDRTKSASDLKSATSVSVIEERKSISEGSWTIHWIIEGRNSGF